MRFLALLAVLFAMVSPLSAASLQEQVEQLKAEIQYIRDNYERSEPVEIVKPVTEYVSPSGELFTSPQPGGVSPTDGSKLEERVSYRKIKFNRRESVNDKIDSAVGAAIDGHVVVGLELLGLYKNTLGAGDAVDATGTTRNANRGTASAGVDFNLSGKPMRNTLMFVNFDAANGKPEVSEAWVSVHGPKKRVGLQAGVIDLTGSFDSNKVANDESSQFLTDEFVNSPLLKEPGSGPGAVLRLDFMLVEFMLGAQNSQLVGTDFFDSLYWIAEAGARYNLLGDGHIRLWARQQPRGSQQLDQALGLSYDHRLSDRWTVFGRYAKSAYVEAYDEATDARTALNTIDWTASGGLELGYFLKQRLRDKLGLAYGRTDDQGGASEQFAELYAKTVLTPNVSLSLHGQGRFSRTSADNEWTTGLRALVSY